MRALMNRDRSKALLLGAGVLALAGCHTDMWRQPKMEAFAESDFYADGAGSRPLVPGTIARSHNREDAAYYTGTQNRRLVTEIPVKVDMALLARGQERFDVYCSPCHGRTGNGQGMIAQRGFTQKRPVGNYHTDRLRNMPVGHFYDVITNGYGTMYSYASRIEPQDRWAIVAYVRALQLSQNAPTALAAGISPDQLSNPPKVDGQKYHGPTSHQPGEHMEHAEGGAEAGAGAAHSEGGTE